MKKTVILKGLCCANCAAKIEENVKKLDSVESATISFITQKLIVEYPEDDEKRILKEIKKIVRRIEPDVEVTV